VSKRSKRRKGGRGARRGPRTASARAAAEYRRGIRQADGVLADEGVEIGAGNWRELALDWFAPEEPDRGELGRYIAAHEPRLGVRWARELLRLHVFFHVDDQLQVIDHYDRALSRYPHCALVEMYVADAVLRQEGDLWRARRMFRDAVDHLPDHAKPRYELGFIHFLLGDNPGALDWYNQAAGRVAKDDAEFAARILYNRGILRHFVGDDKEAAVADLEEALRLMPDYPQAKQALRSLRRKRRWLPW
jgi:tetratricopeptide (TPR) repeat protein